MKSAEEILAEANTTIAGIHNRPTMYVGSTSRPNAADIFDGIIWTAHWFWAVIQSRQRELYDIAASVREAHRCGCRGFSDAYRRQYPDSDELAVFEYVRKCWAEIDAKLGIDISEDAARS